MGVLSGLKPEKVFEYFELLCSVPHGSGNTKEVSDIVASFAKERGLEYYQDGMNNVIIIKDAAAGYENAEPLIIQGHLDMVCAKDEQNPIDMAKEPISLAVEDGWIKAKGTSLGADDGIAVAMAMAVLDDNSIPHPRIEAIFTVDEETGMYGAAAIDLSVIKGKRLLNVDSESEGYVTAGCAGGARLNFALPVRREAFFGSFFEVEVSGLLGGHSGGEIDKGRGNAIKIAAGFLNGARKKTGLRLVSFEGGKFDNVICGECRAKVAVPMEAAETFEKEAENFDALIKKELAKTDAGVKLFVKHINGSVLPVNGMGTENILAAIDEAPQGVRAMSKDIEGLVQTSLNHGIAKLTEKSFDFSISVRSSVGSEKEELINELRAIFEKHGFDVSVHGNYPAWEFKKDSPFRDLVCEVTEEKLGKKAVVTATHGGLECGLLAAKLEGLDCVSVGPDMMDVHSPRERVRIKSVAALYDIILEILKRSK